MRVGRHYQESKEIQRDVKRNREREAEKQRSRGVQDTIRSPRRVEEKSKEAEKQRQRDRKDRHRSKKARREGM